MRQRSKRRRDELERYKQEEAKKNRIFFAIIMTGVIWLIISYASRWNVLRTETEKAERLRQSVEHQRIVNSEMAEILNGDEEELIKRAARELYGYAEQNERIFIEIVR